MAASPEIIDGVIDTFRRAAEANRGTPARRGNVVELDATHGKDVMVTADLHGNRLNFERLIDVADLEAQPTRHLIMQEVCHGGPPYPDDSGCMSHLILEDVAALKVQYPERFHFLLSNHEWAEITDFPISKSNQMLNLTFRCGMVQMYGTATELVRTAYLDFLSTCPLAVRTAGNIWVCHSCPERVTELGFDVSILDRQLEKSDLAPHGDLFRLLWGRDFSAQNAAAFANLVGADLLIHGHEPCEKGYQVPNPHQIILDCCGHRATFVIVPTDSTLGQQAVIQRIQSLNGN
jgi:hypothetical protein